MQQRRRAGHQHLALDRRDDRGALSRSIARSRSAVSSKVGDTAVTIR
ncbi:hypothetical protein ACFQV2_37650 [Actinokineospora soli]|uniref:Uncharacterized protein n=1 Tax=Actinokineospora soli TaxID=1048753 RepID=A0ABW2TXR1_9PSEU